MTSLLILLPLALSLLALRRVPAGQVHSVYRGGRVVRLLQPGLRLVWPLLEQVRHRIDLSGQVLRFEESLPQDGNALRDVRGTVYWQVLEPARADAVIERVDQLIRHSARDALREECVRRMAAPRELGQHLKQLLNAVLRERGMLVTRVELENA